MKRQVLLGLLLVFSMALAACNTAPVDEIYTASGDGSRPDELTRTSTFKADDDLNLVVTLNAHSRTLPVYATFTEPGGATYTTDPIDAGSAVGRIVLGLDFEAQGTTAWTPGEWRAALFVDGDEAESTAFTVEASAAQPAGAG